MVSQEFSRRAGEWSATDARYPPAVEWPEVVNFTAWPDKVLWLNFPSSLHLASDAQVEQATVDLLNEVTSPDGIIIGITEDIPADRWRDSCRAIMDGLSRHVRENPRHYTGNATVR